MLVGEHPKTSSTSDLNYPVYVVSIPTTIGVTTNMLCTQEVDNEFVSTRSISTVLSRTFLFDPKNFLLENDANVCCPEMLVSKILNVRKLVLCLTFLAMVLP